MPRGQASYLEKVPGHDLEGRSLGEFELLREIACGGMATIYLARRQGEGIGQNAAVKVIHPHLSKDRDFVDMFLDEARIVSCINHPNVCGVLDFGRADGTYYLAMEYVMGETWSDVLAALKQTEDGRAMIPALLRFVMTQACEGMHAAHEARDADDVPLSIVHRDVSPQNLMVGYDGSVRVLDFGIASAADRLHTTRNGTIKGRFAYMAPEQMRGLAVDRRADVWSLGVVLWEGLARRRLFKRDTEAETVLAVTSEPLPEIEHPLPSSLLRIVHKALERRREDRFESARELGGELTRISPSDVPPITMVDLSSWMQRMFAERIALKRETLRSAARASLADTPVGPPLPPVAPELAALVARSHVANSQVAPSFSKLREAAANGPVPAGWGGPEDPVLLVNPPESSSPLLGLVVFALLAAATFVIVRHVL